MNIAFFGTGILGFPMAEKILEAGHRLRVYNRTKVKAEPLAKKGAVLCANPAEALKDSDVVVLVLADFPAVEKVLFKSDLGSFKGKTFIQMGTIASKESRMLAQKIHNCGGEYFECPVLGSKIEAASASLILMVGATPEQFKQWRGFLQCFGRQPRHIGPVGTASALKLALNHLIASHAVSFSLSLGLVQKSGVDISQFMAILGESSLTAPMFAKKLPNWLEHRYDNPNFSLKHLVKDVDLIVKEARDNKLDTTVIRSIKNVLEKSVKKGLGGKDYSAVYETINKI